MAKKGIGDRGENIFKKHKDRKKCCALGIRSSFFLG